MAARLRETDCSIVDPLGPAPTQDATRYAQWLRARGTIQANFDAKMGVVRSPRDFKNKAPEWRIGYDKRLSEVLPSR